MTDTDPLCISTTYIQYLISVHTSIPYSFEGNKLINKVKEYKLSTGHTVYCLLQV